MRALASVNICSRRYYRDIQFTFNVVCFESQELGRAIFFEKYFKYSVPPRLPKPSSGLHILHKHKKKKRETNFICII